MDSSSRRISQVPQYHKYIVLVDIVILWFRFSSRLNDFYSPLILLQYIYIVGFTCFSLFNAASVILNFSERHVRTNNFNSSIFSLQGALTPINFMVAITFATVQLLSLFILCWFGQRIDSEVSIKSFFSIASQLQIRRNRYSTKKFRAQYLKKRIFYQKFGNNFLTV